MAVGDVTFASNAKRTICALLATSAANGAPSGPTQAGSVLNYPDPVRSVYGSSDSGACFAACSARNSVVSIDGATGGTYVVWGYLAAANAWYPAKALNAGAAISANYSEVVPELGAYDRLYVQAVSPAGTVNAWITTARTVDF